MECASTNTEHSEFLDKLILLLISRPEHGWEQVFQDITCREIERLTVPAVEVKSDE
jgi:hypothetical protein